jgi:hypothetical protein
MTCTRPAVTEEPLQYNFTEISARRILEADPETISFFKGRHLPVLRHICKECGAVIGDTLHDRPDKGMCARCWKVCHD